MLVSEDLPMCARTGRRVEMPHLPVGCSQSTSLLRVDGAWDAGPPGKAALERLAVFGGASAAQLSGQRSEAAASGSM